jgi:hypothetical protein
VILTIGYLITIAIDRLIGTELGAIPEYIYWEEYAQRVQA